MERKRLGQVVEFGEKVHHRNNVKGENARNKLDGRWHEGYYLGTDWRTGSAWIGTSAGVIEGERDPQDWSTSKVGPGRRVGVCEARLGTGYQLPRTNTLRSSLNHYLKLNVVQFHRPRTIGNYREGSCCARSTSSSMGSQRNVLDVVFFCPERLKGVMGAIPKSARKRMEKVLEETPAGRADLKRARDRLEAERTRQAERILQEQEGQEHLAKKMRSQHQDGHEGASGQGGEPHSGSSSSGSSGLKHNAPEAAPSTPEDITQNQKVRIIEEVRDEERDDDEQMTEQMTDELNWVERMMREDFR